MVYIFAVLIYSEYEQLTPMYDNVSGTSYRNVVTKYLTYFPISQIVSGKGSMSYEILYISYVGIWPFGGSMIYEINIVKCYEI